MSNFRPPSVPANRLFSRFVAPAILLTLALATGCTLPIGASYTGATPQDVVRQKHGPAITVIGARISGNTAVVLSTGRAANPGPASGSSEVYVDVVKRSGLGWNVPLGFTSNGTTAVPPSATFCFATAEIYDQQNVTNLVYGYVRQPDVQKVEVDFSSGETLNDETGDGMFAVIQPMPDAGTTVRALDSNGSVIHTAAIPTPVPQPTPLPASKGVSGGGGISSFTCSP